MYDIRPYPVASVKELMRLYQDGKQIGYCPAPGLPSPRPIILNDAKPETDRVAIREFVESQGIAVSRVSQPPPIMAEIRRKRIKSKQLQAKRGKFKKAWRALWGS